MKILRLFVGNWSVRKVLNIFIVWTLIWLTVLVWKFNKSNLFRFKSAQRISLPGCQIRDSSSDIEYNLLFLTNPYLHVPDCPSRKFHIDDREVSLDRIKDAKNCSITPFYGEKDEKNAYDKPIEISPLKSVTIPKGNFFKIECTGNGNETVFKDYGFLAPTINTANIEPAKKTIFYSVLILGFNKVSYADVGLQLNRTLRFLKKQTNFLEFQAFNGVGADATKNMLAILTGQTDYPMQKNGPYFNNSKFVWKTYSKNNFYTIFGENSYNTRLFHERNKLFEDKPTDYYLWPFTGEISDDKTFEAISKTVIPAEVKDPHLLEPKQRFVMPLIEEKCVGSRHEQHIIVELMEQLLPIYEEHLTFSFYMFSKQNPFLPNDDAAIEKILRNYEEAGILKHTFVFIVSVINSKTRKPNALKQPVLYVLVPEEFRELHPTAFETLRGNAQRLVTPYDLHATLLELADLYGSPNASPLGKSLLDEILPESRTCQSANISSKHCLCQR